MPGYALTAAGHATFDALRRVACVYDARAVSGMLEHALLGAVAEPDAAPAAQACMSDYDCAPTLTCDFCTHQCTSVPLLPRPVLSAAAAGSQGVNMTLCAPLAPASWSALQLLLRQTSGSSGGSGSGDPLSPSTSPSPSPQAALAPSSPVHGGL
ncbi:MAG: hypothetical protein EOO41_04140, partial [Methanobacteriota archaeon]